MCVFVACALVLHMCVCSCDPNAIVVFERDAVATVAALRPITMGEEICISYIDTGGLSTAERRLELMDYGFACDCSRCCCEAGAPQT
jgi:hypothetical protein|eukprot:SAG25_NODE_108_length_15257_cov_63.784404_2_plen_87_part_00